MKTAVEYCQTERGDGHRNHCLLNVRRAFGISALYPTAYAAWLGAGGKHGANTHTVIPAPPNVPIFFKGAAAAGHVVVSAGDGWCYTTDWNGNDGQWTKVRVADIVSRWNYRYLGWSETLNGRRVHPHVTVG